MRSRIFGASLVLLGIFIAAARPAADPDLKWAAVNLKDTTVIAGAFVSGPVVFVHDESGDGEGVAPATVGRQVTTVLALNIPDVDRLWEQAVGAGCEVIYPLADQFYGDRGGRLRDPFGHQWMLSTHIEDVNKRKLLRVFYDPKSRQITAEMEVYQRKDGKWTAVPKPDENVVIALREPLSVTLSREMKRDDPSQFTALLQLAVRGELLAGL